MSTLQNQIMCKIQSAIVVGVVIKILNQEFQLQIFKICIEKKLNPEINYLEYLITCIILLVFTDSMIFKQKNFQNLDEQSSNQPRYEK